VDAACDIVHDDKKATGVSAKRPTQQAHAEKSTVQISRSLSPNSDTVLLDHGVTAYYALVDLARVRSGDLVLIDRASGWVGRMAVFIAQRYGAQVFATALLEDKQFLVHTLGIAEDRIFFTDNGLSESGLLQNARDDGFHVVLSGLPCNDDHFRSLLKRVAAGGHLVIARGIDNAADGEALSIPRCPFNISVSLIDLGMLSPTIRAHKTQQLRNLITEDVSKFTSFIVGTPRRPAEESLVTRNRTTSTVWFHNIIPIVGY
jgi:NADPH:quinone reductase-like Zn-dependent oxidoreductase